MIEVVYENGVFNPLEKVNLKEGEKVKVIPNLDPVELAKEIFWSWEVQQESEF